MVSWYYWMKNLNGPKAQIPLSEFLKSYNPKKIMGECVYKIDGETGLDKIYKFENLDDALIDIANRLTLPDPIILPQQKIHSFSRLNKRHYREMLNQDDADMISKQFANVITEQGYSL